MSPTLSAFLDRARKVLDRNRFWKWGAICGAAGAFVALGLALGWWFAGYQVPIVVVLSALGAGVALAVVSCFALRSDREDAARAADRKFELKDALTTAYHFAAEERAGEVYELQRSQAEAQVQGLAVADLQEKRPVRWAVAGVAAAALAFGVASIPPSDEVLARLEQERLTEERTTEAKKHLEEVVEELAKSLDEDEIEVMNPNELRKWVQEIEPSKDHREVMRQFARAEQKIADKMREMEQRKEEALMKQAAEELEKSKKAEARQLGKDIEREELRKAAQKLQDMKLAQRKKMAGKKMTPEEREKMKKQVERLRAISKRMAAAAANPNLQNKGANGKAEQGDMQANMAQLDALAQQIEDMLEEAELGKELNEEELKKLLEQLRRQREQLEGRMKRMGARKGMLRKLGKLRRRLGRAQRFALGRGKLGVLGLASGKKPGSGTSDQRRNERDELQDNGQYSQLSGQKGEGPSLSKIEDAADGTGVSGRRGEARERSFQRQFESFVRRDDVPDDVKSGVREYFERIHQYEDEPATEPQEPAE